MSDPASNASFTSAIGSELVQKSKVHYNLGQDVIIVTEDRMRLKIDRYLKRVVGSWFWLTPLSILVAIVLSLITATFHDWIFKAEIWNAIFLVAAVILAVWTLVAICNAIRSRTCVDDLLNELKKATREQAQAEKH
jgi:hypothetical protein